MHSWSGPEEWQRTANCADNADVLIFLKSGMNGLFRQAKVKPAFCSDCVDGLQKRFVFLYQPEIPEKGQGIAKGDDIG